MKVRFIDHVNHVRYKEIEVKNMENYRPYIKEFHTTKKQNYIMAYGGQI